MPTDSEDVSIPAALACAVEAARATGAVMRANLHAKKRVHVSARHDIKLELDLRCQKLIERTLRRRFPNVPILGEEGDLGNAQSRWRWVVDPIDGTVNFTFGIPHACVSIALQVAMSAREGRRRGGWSGHRSVVGVVYDPFCDELWTAVAGEPSRMNGRVIHVSDRRTLIESIVSIGFTNERANLLRMLPSFNALVHRVLKLRIMGAAALGLVYVASGRMDAYVEHGLNLWDIAAGGLIIEGAGGQFFHEPIPGQRKFSVVATNGHLHKSLQRLPVGGMRRGRSRGRTGEPARSVSEVA